MQLIQVVCHQIDEASYSKLEKAARRFAEEFAAAGMEITTTHHCGDGRACDPGKEEVGPRLSLRTTVLGKDTLGSFASRLPTLLEYLGISNRTGTVSAICFLDADAHVELLE